MVTTSVPKRSVPEPCAPGGPVQHAHRARSRPTVPARRRALVLAWIFIYHGVTAALRVVRRTRASTQSGDYFAHTAHLHPGELFAVLGGVIEFGGGIALALGLFSRLAGAAIFGDMMMAIITVTWANGINATGGNGRLRAEPGPRRSSRSSSPSSVPVASASTRCSNAAW